MDFRGLFGWFGFQCFLTNWAVRDAFWCITGWQRSNQVMRTFLKPYLVSRSLTSHPSSASSEAHSACSVLEGLWSPTVKNMKVWVYRAEVENNSPISLTVTIHFVFLCKVLSPPLKTPRSLIPKSWNQAQNLCSPQGQMWLFLIQVSIKCT